MKFTYKEKEYYIDKLLATQLISICYNLKKDHDFVIIITGDRTVRVGKSVLGLTVSAFLAYTIQKMGLQENPFSIDNVYFDNKEMLDKAIKSPLYCVHQYDEGREGLSVSKHMKDFQKDLLDFFAECGQLNNVFVVVLPDFFDLKEDIAVPRSEFLINVYRKETLIFLNGDKLGFPGEKIPAVRLDRGFFEFYSRKKKSLLYDIAKAKHQKRYGLVKANFIGRFTNQYTVDEQLYRQKKMTALKRFVEKKAEEKEYKLPAKLAAAVDYLKAKDAKALKEAAEETGQTKGNLNKHIRNHKNDLKDALGGTSL